jgi:hypothetical protein
MNDQTFPRTKFSFGVPKYVGVLFLSIEINRVTINTINTQPHHNNLPLGSFLKPLELFIMPFKSTSKHVLLLLEHMRSEKCMPLKEVKFQYHGIHPQ